MDERERRKGQARESKLWPSIPPKTAYRSTLSSGLSCCLTRQLRRHTSELRMTARKKGKARREARARMRAVMGIKMSAAKECGRLEGKIERGKREQVASVFISPQCNIVLGDVIYRSLSVITVSRFKYCRSLPTHLKQHQHAQEVPNPAENRAGDETKEDELEIPGGCDKSEVSTRAESRNEHDKKAPGAAGDRLRASDPCRDRQVWYKFNTAFNGQISMFLYLTMHVRNAHTCSCTHPCTYTYNYLCVTQGRRSGLPQAERCSVWLPQKKRFCSQRRCSLEM